MHAAKLSISPRLQRTFKVLLDGKEHTTRDLIRKASICAVNSVIAELKENGINITCERRGDLWYYRIVTQEKGYLL
jgi:hypothetical protein